MVFDVQIKSAKKQAYRIMEKKVVTRAKSDHKVESNELEQNTGNNETAIVMSADESELVGMGLTLKEAKHVIQMRSARTENIGIRVNKDELAGIDELHDYLLVNGYIKEGRANLLVYLVATAIKPEKKQLEADLK